MALDTVSIDHSDLNGNILGIPDLLCILFDATIRAEEAHSRHGSNGLGQPFVLVFVRLIDELLRVDVALEVVGDQVVIAMVDNAVDQSAELACIAERPVADGVKNARQLRVELEAAVEVVVTEIFDILGEITEQEDVVLADFSGDLNVRTVTAARNGARQFLYLQSGPLDKRILTMFQQVARRSKRTTTC